jgi:DNA topoisomerase IB
VRQPAVLRRIRSLAIPPAYEDVWICPSPDGHLQATGYDSRRRKQYRYHPQWRALRDRAKFERMSQFGAGLPRLRAHLRRDLARDGLPREKVLALVVALLDATCTRVGNDQYARENGSYGLTTLRNRHAQIFRSGRLRLRFRGKGGQAHELEVDNMRLARIARRCKQLPGQRLFQYLGDDGQVHAVDSGDVNAYLAEAMDGPFTAKDFRTWNATLRAIALLRVLPLPRSKGAINAGILEVVRTVAQELRNTPAICRKSYINPVVFEAWRSGLLRQAVPYEIGKPSARAERWAVRFLRRAGKTRLSSPPRA